MITKLRKLGGRLRDFHALNPVAFFLRLAAVLIIGWIFIAKRIFWTPDTLFFMLLALFFVFGQIKAFVTRLAPFVLLLLIYESFRSIADQLNTHVHYKAMIDIDHFLFHGALPTAWLQHFMWNGHLQWYDFYFYLLYTLHFFVPVLLAVFIWKVRDRLYWQYVAAFIGLSFAAFLTYLVFPAAPPWMASDHGQIQHIHRISSDIWQAMGVKNFSEFYNNLSPNQVAAVPSLHSAYPLLAVLFIAKMFTWRRTWWLMIYPISVWAGVVYLGEHYVTDVILGVLYAIAAYQAAGYVFALKGRYGSLRNILVGSPKLADPTDSAKP